MASPLAVAGIGVEPIGNAALQVPVATEGVGADMSKRPILDYGVAISLRRRLCEG
jgi:hypothetical protein